MLGDFDPRLGELVEAFRKLKRLAGSPTLLDIADRALQRSGPDTALSKSTISEIMRGNLRSKNGPQVMALIDALVSFAPEDSAARAIADHATELWTAILRPAISWSTSAAQHFASLEWSWGKANVYPSVRGWRHAMSITCMGQDQRPTRPEVFTFSMRKAVLACIDWGTLRRHGALTERVTPSATGFRAWGPISAAYGAPRRFVSIDVHVNGATSCYYFAEREFEDDFGSPAELGLSALIAVQALIGSRGVADVAVLGDGGEYQGELDIPDVGAQEQFTGYGWPHTIYERMRKREAKSSKHDYELLMAPLHVSRESPGPLETLGPRIPDALQREERKGRR